MQKEKRKSRNLFVLFLLPILLLSACTNQSLKPAESKNNDFLLKLYTDKDAYKDGEEIVCYATVQYTGSAENITIYGGRPLLTFSIKNSEGDTVGALRELVLSGTEFKKGEIKHYDYEKNGGFDESSPEWVKEFLSYQEFYLPKGAYTIIANLEYAYDMNGSFETLDVSKKIEVT